MIDTETDKTCRHEVFRTDTGHLCVKGIWLIVEDVVEATYQCIKKAGSKNIAFDMPPFLYTGCPYPDAILDLGCTPVLPPNSYRIEYVEQDGKKPWHSRTPIWPVVFDVDKSLHEN